uniref:Uncharacterized protein n=1 Tax=viral metagenome TaxID=1070528 RepID=A0A6C0DKJ1_9ZZZZ
MKFGICVRSFLEGPYLDFFIEHYISLGFDKILIFKSDKEEYYVKEKYEKYVKIINVENTGNSILQENIYHIKNSGCDWTFFPDMDEILILNKEYKNIREFVERKLKIFPQINMFYFRWGMIEKYDIEANNTFKNIVNTYNIFSSRFIKSMVKTSSINILQDPHSCKTTDNSKIYLEGEIINTNKSVHDLQSYSYNRDTVLIHIHTRSIHNIIIKSLYTTLNAKQISSLSAFINYINNFTEDTKLIEKFMNIIGQKAKLPFFHAESRLSNIDLSRFTIPEYSTNTIDLEQERCLILKFLTEFNINEEKYYIFINGLNKEIQRDFRRFYKE